MRVMVAALLVTLLLGGLPGCQGAAENPSPVVAPPVREEGMDLESQVMAARAHLGERLGLPGSEIALLEARHVTWPDSSLGCPQPGLMYMQVLTPGVLIRLDVEGREYRYHGRTGGRPLLCLYPDGEPLPGLEDR
jgi:hypothetical protein